MRTAIIAKEGTLEGIIPEFYNQGDFLIIYDDEAGVCSEIIKVFNKAKTQGDGDIFFAKQIVAMDCEVVICGQIEEVPFLVIADECQVTRFDGSDKKASAALKMMEMEQLSYITDYIGGAGCPSEGSAEHD